VSSLWPVIKEAAGFLGAVFVAVPWLRDFNRRSKLTSWLGIRATGSIKAITDDLAAEHEGWLARAKPSDLAWTLSGLGLIAASFAIGVWLEW
jgi:hypothetical protein